MHCNKLNIGFINYSSIFYEIKEQYDDLCDKIGAL